MKILSLLFIILFLPLAVLSQEIQVLKVGNVGVEYDEVVEADTDENGVNDRKSFYRGGQLVFTSYDRDEDGTNDLWFQYDDELYLAQTLEDKDADGTPDEAIYFNRNEEVVKTENLKGGIGLSAVLISLGVIIVLAVIAFVYRGKIKAFTNHSAGRGELS